MQNQTDLHTLVLDSLEEQIAVIDQSGTIIYVNDSWSRFGIENGISSGHSSAGCNYFKTLSTSVASGDSLAGDAAQGMLDVVNGKCNSFYFEYPCHSPSEKRWFMMRVTRLRGDSMNLFVVSHHNITMRKLAEERAENLAMHDPLTGLANRRHFDLTLNNELRRSTRNQSPISLIMLDIDYFKNYNDELGHLAGDRCLTEVGQILIGLSHRPSDLAARFGGDEFALLLGDTGVVEARKVAEAIQKSINDLKMVFGGSRQVTASMGVASVIPHKQQKADFLLQEADKALYRAKSAGRNRVVQTPLATENKV